MKIKRVALAAIVLTLLAGRSTHREHLLRTDRDGTDFLHSGVPCDRDQADDYVCMDYLRQQKFSVISSGAAAARGR